MSYGGASWAGRPTRRMPSRGDNRQVMVHKAGVEEGLMERNRLERFVQVASLGYGLNTGGLGPKGTRRFLQLAGLWRSQPIQGIPEE